MTLYSRREFFKECLRYISAFLLIYSGLYLFKRSWKEENQCSFKQPLCESCARLKNCFLPTAASFKRYQQQGILNQRIERAS